MSECLQNNCLLDLRCSPLVLIVVFGGDYVDAAFHTSGIEGILWNVVEKTLLPVRVSVN